MVSRLPVSPINACRDVQIVDGGHGGVRRGHSKCSRSPHPSPSGFTSITRMSRIPGISALTPRRHRQHFVFRRDLPFEHVGVAFRHLRTSRRMDLDEVAGNAPLVIAGRHGHFEQTGRGAVKGFCRSVEPISGSPVPAATSIRRAHTRGTAPQDRYHPQALLLR